MPGYDPDPKFIDENGAPRVMGGDNFRDLLITSNPMTIPITNTFWPKTRISSGISRYDTLGNQVLYEPQITFKILSADGAIIERN